ncbi:carbohydrate ABC transporter permease [uncultured Pseudokineococcus sp.]|uniref:carbohydrate ABC transporter permease n=1 Tax=uncultured Pseudokineococcus sp. TaxID=1642928 RepID=UPI002601CC84|nr:sugar ABC transporter permease [uncultured Pseudokineococcus sp.]
MSAEAPEGTRRAAAQERSGASSAGAPSSRPGRRPGRGRDLRTAVLFLGPALAAIVLLRLVPFAGAAWSTLFERVGVGLLAEQRFAGFANYQQLLSDPLFLGTLWRTIAFNLVINPVQIALAMAISVLLVQRLPGRGLWRVFVFVPCTVPLVGSSVAWGVALRQDGPVNGILTALGLAPQPFFTSPQQALASIALVASWIGIGYWMLFLIGGLNDVNRELYEAASLDGAGRWRTFTSVTVPMMKRPLLFVLVADTVANFVLFVPVQLLTNGGPDQSTTMLMFDAYRRTYTYSQPNLGATAILILTLIMLAIVAVQFRLLKEED